MSQLKHGLQAAQLARESGASEALVVAALLHDVGHLLNPASETASREGRDLAHEQSGARFLERWFARDVSAPVALHVAAKRYLARSPDYLAALSEESRRTLALQGGPMSDGQAEQFLAQPGAADALRLRTWDDAAKRVDWQGPDLDSYRELAERLTREGA